MRGPRPLTDVDLDAARAALETQRRDICALLDKTQEEAAPVALDQAQQGRLSRMDAMARQEMAQAARRRRHQDLARINAALGRIATGDYGFCVRCDEAIEPGRLGVDPATPLCRRCAADAS